MVFVIDFLLILKTLLKIENAPMEKIGAFCKQILSIFGIFTVRDSFVNGTGN